jgi:hypothetical protein
MWHEAAMFKFNVLARHFYGGAEVNDESLQSEKLTSETGGTSSWDALSVLVSVTPVSEM